MKAQTIILIILMTLLLPATVQAPTGFWHTVIRIQETSTGTVLTDLPVWREVSE